VTDLDRSARRAAAGTLVLARIVYAFNWYNVGAVLPNIGRGLDATTGQLGIVLGAFLVGAGLFQVPAGVLAMRWGYRTTSIFALGLMGVFCLASAVSPDWIVLAVLRFGAGAGAAFFFAPALGLVSSYYATGSRGPVIGVYNSGFSIGSAGGLFAGALIGASAGWPWALAVGGIALLVVGGGAALALPATDRRDVPPDWSSAWRAGRPLLRSRNLWALSLGLSGVWTAFYAAAQYFVQFANALHPEWPIALAAGLPTAFILTEVLGGPIGGWFAERRADMRRILVMWGAASGVGVLLIPFLPLEALWPLFIFLGFADGVIFAVLYLVPTYLLERKEAQTALAIGIVNSIQLFLGSLFAVLFAVVAGGVSYEAAWVFAGLLGVGFLPLLLFLEVPRSGGATDAANGPAGT
jgi:MFS transporter, ACDE family, multidrug resistance protein